jgi:hypothetical protein
LQELERRPDKYRIKGVSNQIFKMEKDGLHGTRGYPDGAKSERLHTTLEVDHDMNAMRPSLGWEHMAKNNLHLLCNVFKAVAQTFVPADMEVVRWKKLWG